MGKLVGFLGVLVLYIIGLLGWCFNTYHVVVNFINDVPFTTKFIGQIIGVVVFPLGSILGWF